MIRNRKPIIGVKIPLTDILVEEDPIHYGEFDDDIYDPEEDMDSGSQSDLFDNSFVSHTNEVEDWYE
jgi:hypothetical protein